MATAETAWKKTDGPVRYHGGSVTTEPGDRVEIRGLFWTRRGVVNYVPGISPPHEEMEHNFLYWVGVALEKGRFTGILVDPDTGCARKTLVFVARGTTEGVDPLPDAPFP